MQTLSDVTIGVVQATNQQVVVIQIVCRSVVSSYSKYKFDISLPCAFRSMVDTICKLLAIARVDEYLLEKNSVFFLGVLHGSNYFVNSLPLFG